MENIENIDNIYEINTESDKNDTENRAENKSAAKKCAAAVIFLSLMLGAAAGYSLFGQFGQNGVSITSGTFGASVSGIRDIKTILINASGICKSELIQFAVVFASAFTLFSYPVCAAVLFYRGAAAGHAFAAVIANSASDAVIISQCVSYCVVTLILAVLAFASCGVSGKFKVPRKGNGGASPFGISLSHVYIFLMTSGAAALLKLLSAVISERLGAI